MLSFFSVNRPFAGAASDQEYDLPIFKLANESCEVRNESLQYRGHVSR